MKHGSPAVCEPYDGWWNQWTHGSRLFLERIPAGKYEKGKASARRTLEEMQQGGGIKVLDNPLFAMAVMPFRWLIHP